VEFALFPWKSKAKAMISEEQTFQQPKLDLSVKPRRFFQRVSDMSNPFSALEFASGLFAEFPLDAASAFAGLWLGPA